jgi:pilus assembly protein Flp/PilA
MIKSIQNLKLMLDMYIPSVETEEEGQGMVEYGLILALVSIVAIAVLVFLGPAVADIFQEVTDELENVGGED